MLRIARGARALVLLVAVTALLVGSAASRAQDPAAAPSAGPGDYFDPADPVYAAARERALGDVRETAAERRERVQSRDAYEDLSDIEAVRLAREEFPEVLTGPVEAGQRLEDGMEIAELTGQFTAQVQTAAGEPVGLLESGVPLSTDTAGGSPVDLSLEAEGGGFVPADAIVPVRLPAVADEAALLPRDGIAFRPVGADAAAAVQRADRLLYPSIDTDTDYILQATESGAEAFWSLRSVASPGVLRQRFALPDGARLVALSATGDAPAGIAVVRGDETLATIDPVWALDAADRPVGVAVEIDGDELVLRVDHRDPQVVHPVLVDPRINGQPHEHWAGSQWQNCGAGSPSQGWNREIGGHSPASHWYQTCYNDYAGWGNWIGAHTYSPMTQGAYIQSNYWARPNTYIQNTWWNNFRHGSQYHTDAYVGLWSDHGSPGNAAGWRQLHMTTGTWGPGYVSHDVGNYRDSNRAVIGLRYQNSAYSAGTYTGVDSVSMLIGDGQAPSDVRVASTSAGAVATANNGRTFPWSSTIPSMSIEAMDIGLGIRSMGVLSSDSQRWLWGPVFLDKNGNETTDAAACDGTKANPCKAYSHARSSGRNFNTWAIAEGVNEGRLRAFDAGGRHLTSTGIIRVEYSRHALSIQYGGPNALLDTDAEVAEALVALDPVATRQSRYDAFHDADKATIMANDAQVRWGEEPPLDTDGTGNYLMWDGEERADNPDIEMPVSEQEAVIFNMPDPRTTGTTSACIICPIVIVAACKVFCDDGVKHAAKPLVRKLVKGRKPQPRSWKTQRPNPIWVARAGVNASGKLADNIGPHPGGGFRAYWHAHHIVAAGHRGARVAQNVLIQCGVYPNDARNGVWLPKDAASKKTLGSDRQPHSKLHTTHYIENINKSLVKNHFTDLGTPAQKCERVLNVLAEWKALLQAGKMPG